MVFRSVVQSWLRQAAVDAIKQRTAPADGATSDLPLECDLGLVFAMGMEAGGLEDLLQDVQQIHGADLRAVTGRYRGRRVALMVTGMGRAAAERGTHALISSHHPRWVISAGYSGGLCPEARWGDIVLANRISDGSAEAIPVPLPIDPGSAQQAGLHVGSLVTVENLVCRPDEKAALGQQSGAIAVDMESMSVAEVCRQQQVPFLAVRIISDDVEAELPEFLGRYSQQKSLAGKTGVVVGALLQRPTHFKTMYNLREESLKLSDRLGRFLASLICELIPEPPREDSSEVAQS